MKGISITIIVSLLIIGLAAMFGVMDKPTEMSIIVVAGAIALAFLNIDKIQKFKGAGFEAEMKMVHSIIEKETEPEIEAVETTSHDNSYSNKELAIISSLDNQKYTWRYAKTVSKEVGTSMHETNLLLEKLKNQGLVNDAQGSYGVIWTLTLMGRQLSGRKNIDLL